MQLGEIVFGGVGTGLYGMIVFVVLTVFIAGLMVGRTPEYLGKKIERREVQLAILAILVLPLFALSADGALGARCRRDRDARQRRRARLLRDALRVQFHDREQRQRVCRDRRRISTSTSLTGIGRCSSAAYLFMIPALALAGSLAGKQSVPETSGTFTTYSPSSSCCYSASIVIVGALTFFPADALGPIVEHLLMLQGKTF